MALEQIKLDDLTWADMVKAIRRRIAADSNGDWTLHAPVDPGVTLLELFAWLIEQRIYRLDQIPDPLVRASLRLLGEQATPTQSAATVFQFQAKEFLSVPAKTTLGVASANPPIVFSTDAHVTLLPVFEEAKFQTRLGLFVGGKDRTADLYQRRVMRLVPAEAKDHQVKIVFWLTKPLDDLHPKPHDGRFSVFFELRAPKKVPPHWSPEAKNVPPPAEIDWSYSTSGGRLADFKPEEIEDGTGGLRRSGVVRLPLKDDWEIDSSIGKENGLFAYSIVLEVSESTFTSPPRLVRLCPNVMIARHRRGTASHRLQAQWLPLPGNAIALSELPKDNAIKDTPVIEHSVRLRLKERDNVWHRWHRTADLLRHGPSERVFTVDRERGLVLFGDGLTGRLPVLRKIDPGNPNDYNVLIRYQVGGGSVGNVGAGSTWNSGDLEARNIVAAIGGSEAETMTAARQRMSAELRQRNRAITTGDHESIAVTTPGVAFERAHAAIGLHPGHSCPVPGAMTVFVVPEAPREGVTDPDVEDAFVLAPQPDPASLAVARARFDKARLVTSELFVSGPRYRDVALRLEIESDALDEDATNRRVKDRLKTFLDPLTGGEQGHGWPFGEPLRPSALMREVQRALGDDGVVNAVEVFLDNQPPKNSCDDVQIGAHDLVTLQDVIINLNQSRESHGGLR